MRRPRQPGAAGVLGRDRVEEGPGVLVPGLLQYLLGQTVLGNLFGEFSDPVGATVLVKNVPMTVVGVLAAKGHSPSGQDQDDVVLIPFSTADQNSALMGFR